MFLEATDPFVTLFSATQTLGASPVPNKNASFCDERLQKNTAPFLSLWQAIDAVWCLKSNKSWGINIPV